MLLSHKPKLKKGIFRGIKLELGVAEFPMAIPLSRVQNT